MKMNFALKRNTLFLTIVVTLGLIGLASAQTLPLAMQSEMVISGDYANGVVSGNYLYVASGYGLAIYDISNTTMPVLVTNYGTTGEAYDVAILYPYAMVADGYKGLAVIDITDPGAPVTVAEVPLGGNARSLAVSADNIYLLVALEEQGIVLLNVSSPWNPTITSIYNTATRAVDVAHQGSYFFVSDQEQLISFSYTGGVLALVSEYTGVSDARGICYQGGRIVTADYGYGLRFINVTNGVFGTQAYQFTTYTTTNDVIPFGASNVAVSLGTNGVSVVSGTGGQLGHFSNILDNAKVSGLHAFGNNLIFAAQNEFGFQVLDAAILTNITIESEVSLAGGPRASVTYSTATGKYAFVAYYSGGVKIIEITDPRNPVLVGTIPIDGWSYDVDVMDHYLFVVEYWTGVYSYDITNPLSPMFLDQFPILPVGGNGTRACAIDGTNLYVVHYDQGLYKLNVSNPSNITQVGTTYNTDGSPRDIKVDTDNDLAFIADFNGGCDIIDISGTPIQLSTYTALGEVHSVDFIGSTLFVGSLNGEIDILDITNPASPVYLTTYTTEGEVQGLNVDSQYYVYASDWERGLEVFYAINPLAPVYAGSFDTHGLGKAGFVDGNYFHMSDFYSYYIFALGGAVDASIPTDLLGIIGQNVTIPINVSDVTGLGVTAWEGAISFDDDILNYVGYDVTGTLCATGWTIVPNIQPGVLNIGGFSTTAATGEGILVNLIFAVDPAAVVGSETPLVFDDWQFNEGRPVDYTHDGLLTVTALYQVDGTIAYYMGTMDPVANMTVDLTGDNNYTTMTNTSGYYLFPDVFAGSYTNNANKTETAYQPFWIINFGDAVTCAQGAVGLITLTEGQIVAADVSGDGTVSFFDASQIAQYSVHSLLTGIHFAVSLLPDNSDWETIPDTYTHDPLTASVTDDFDGILYGDVDGNWSAGLVSTAPVVNNSILGTCVLNGDLVTVPVRVTANASEAYFFQGEMLYNAEQLEFQSISLAPNLNNVWHLEYNASEAGHLRFGAFNTTALNAAGDVAYVVFKVLDDDVAIDLQLTNFFTQANSTVYSASTMIVPAGVPTAYALNQNYPNPFNPDTQIRFDIKDRGHVTLIIYIALGQKVRTLVDGTMNPGAYSRLFNGKDDRGMELSSGLYFYQIKANDFSDTRKMILVK